MREVPLLNQPLWRYYDDMEQIWLTPNGSMMLLVDVEDRSNWGSRSVSKHWWLLVDGVPVAFLHTLAAPGSYNEFMACDIEVRETHRGQGYVTCLIAAVEAQECRTLYTTGSYTPAGHAALGHRMPLVPGSQARVVFDDMTFVTDWDNFIPDNPLH